MLVKDNIKKDLKEFTEMYIDIAREYYDMELPIIPIRYDLKGQCAGQFWNCPREGKYLRYNLVIATENWDDYLSQTVPHEVAHYVQRVRYGNHDSRGRRIRPHGKEWKSIMVNCFQIKPERCHSYETENVRTLKIFKYSCHCREWELTSIRHNKMVEGTANYHCKKCLGTLRYKGA
jgi:SprT protein